jgi:hypothetical protein
MAQTCAVCMSADMMAPWEPIRRQYSAIHQMIIPASQSGLAYWSACQFSFDRIPLPVVQSFHPLALASNIEVPVALLPDSKGHFVVIPLRQSSHLQIPQDVLCGGLLQVGTHLGRVGDSDRRFIADMPTAHFCATQRKKDRRESADNLFFQKSVPVV